MTTILYPTRGGQNSYPNQDLVIAMAKEQNAELIFLHVANANFMENIGYAAHLDIIEEELDRLSEFLLVMAQERAKKSGAAKPMVCAEHIDYRNMLEKQGKECGSDHGFNRVQSGKRPRILVLQTP